MVKKTDFPVVISEMPECQETFIIELPFSVTEDWKNRLMDGHIPENMEDKWFLYSEDNLLYICRSWTGYCMYKVHFLEGNRIMVTANRDPRQYIINYIINNGIKSEYQIYDKTILPYILAMYSR